MSQNQQKLGGQRKGSPLDDEDCFPLTLDEYLTIKENLIINKFTTLESVLLSVFVTTLISGIIFISTNSFYILESFGDSEKEIINTQNIIITIAYSAVCLGSLIGLTVSLSTKKKTKKAIERLDGKIMKHLKKDEL